MKLENRRALELRHQGEALARDFLEWRRQSNPHTELEKHQSQIVRITTLLERFLEESWATPATVDDNVRMAAALLFAHHSWAYFRSKFALRTVKALKDTLQCADEFAWECYEPLLKRATEVKRVQPGTLKEPPLTFYNSGASPLVRRRDTPYLAEGVTSADAARFGRALSLMPIPMIGLPWVHNRHIPSALVVAHEVGHAVEQDFQISGALDRGLARLVEVDEQRLEGWQAWRSELFADLFGILCGGPAYVIALVSYLIAPPQTVMHESIDSFDWGDYPTRSLRLEFNLAVLEQLNLEDAGLRRAWAEAYPRHTMEGFDEFCKEAAHVASVFLTTPIEVLGNVPLSAVICTTPDEWDEIKKAALPLALGQQPGISRKEEGSSVFRGWFAAATWAYYQDPEAYMGVPSNQALAMRLAQAIPGGTRAAVRRRSEKEEAALRSAQAVADVETAQALVEMVFESL